MQKNNNQTINCTVTSCRYNDKARQACELQAIVVEPCKDVSNGTPEGESMCGNYRVK